MYIIIAYVIVAILGAIAGEITDVLIFCFSKHKRIFSKANFSEYLSTATPRYLLMVIHIIIYAGILTKFGSNDIHTIKYIVLTPLLISAFYIDHKKQIIPNRLTLTVFECGMIFLFIQGMYGNSVMSSVMHVQGVSDISIVIRMLQGMVAGAAIFLLITLIGGLIFGKETMGFGDVKLMGALGLFFEFQGIIAISILAFLVAAVYSIGLLIVQKIRHKESVEYIAFGPFIVIASFIVMFVNMETLMMLPFIVFSFGKYRL